MLGRQVTSRKKSAAAYGFGSGTRDQQAKIFVSQEHAALQGTSDSPGPAVYTQRASVGPQVSGAKESSPLWTFGTEDRWAAKDRESGMTKYAVAVPGAGTYDAGVGVGKHQPESKMKTLPAYGFGSSSREDMSKVFISEEMDKVRQFGRGSPGPASFMLNPAVGKQVNGAVQLPLALFACCVRHFAWPPPAAITRTCALVLTLRSAPSLSPPRF